MVAPDVDAAPVREQLGRDEQLLWSGRPYAGLHLQAGDAWVIPFSLAWNAFVFAMARDVLAHDTWSCFTPMILLFVLVGVYVLVGRFFWDVYVRRHRYYGVSNQRVIIVTQLWSTEVTSLPLRSLQEMTVSVRGNRGTIEFPRSALHPRWWERSTGAGGVTPALELIGNARQVGDLIREAQRGADDGVVG